MEHIPDILDETPKLTVNNPWAQGKPTIIVLLNEHSNKMNPTNTLLYLYADYNKIMYVVVSCFGKDVKV